jgi:hypothetical protein
MGEWGTRGEYSLSTFHCALFLFPLSPKTQNLKPKT